MGARPPTFRGGVIRYRKRTNIGTKHKNEQSSTIVEKHENPIKQEELLPAPPVAAAAVPNQVDTASFVLVEEKKNSYCNIQ